MRRVWEIALCLALILGTAACRNTAPVSGGNDGRQQQAEQEETELKILVDGAEIPVTWELNAAVEELKAEAARGAIEVEMSRYGGKEQVGPLGRSYPRDDRQITARNGDIVLYSGDQIVLLYGSNSWSYTRLGKIDLPEDEVVDLLSGGDIRLTITKEEKDI